MSFRGPDLSDRGISLSVFSRVGKNLGGIPRAAGGGPRNDNAELLRNDLKTRLAKDSIRVLSDVVYGFFIRFLAIFYAARCLIRAGLLSASCREKIGCVRNRGKRRHGPTFDFRIVRRHGDASVLRTRESQPLVHPGVCRSLRARLGLWISSRRMAIRPCGGCLGSRCRPPLVGERQFEITNRLQRYDQKIIQAMDPAAPKKPFLRRPAHFRETFAAIGKRPRPLARRVFVSDEAYRW